MNPPPPPTPHPFPRTPPPPPKKSAEALFATLVNLTTPEDRERALADACADDDALAGEVRALLAAHEAAGDFMKATVQLPPEVQAELARLKPEEAGERIGPYKLLQQIGEGGFGTVWMAEQEQPVRRRVALKIIKLGMDTKHVVARFEQERQALAMMDHPNIAKVFDAGATPTGRPFFVMELVRGIRITDYCDQANLPTAERLQLFIAVCHAVQHAHQKGIIHRDLKPSNILVTLQDGVPVPKVIDFGVAKATEQRLTDLTLVTQFEQMIGTPLYMSPEQAGMSGLDIDTRADIYALGVLLYELLTGCTPFDPAELMRRGLDEIRRVIREQEPPRPSTALSTMAADAMTAVAQHRQSDSAKLIGLLRGDLDWIVMKAIEKDRTRRYDTANAFADDIQRHLTSEPVTARPPSAGYRLRKLVRRNRLVFGAAACILVLLAAGITVSTWQAVRATRAENLAEGRLNQVTAEKLRADDEAATAKAVNEFLQYGLLAQAGSSAQADSGDKPNPNLTVREALDRAGKSIESRFPDRPLIEAAIRDTIGRSYDELGQPESALPHFQRAIKLRSESLGAEHPETLMSRNNLAAALHSQGRNAEAEQEHRAVLEVFERVLGAEYPETLLSRNNLAVVLYSQGKYAEAEQEHRAVIKIRERVLGAEHPDTLSSRGNLANALQAQGKNAEAEREHLAMIEINERVLGAEHPETLSSRNNLANALDAQGKNAEAEQEDRAVIKLRERVLGAEHPETLSSRNNLASVLQAQGKNGEAEQEHRTVLAIMERVQGAEHPNTLMSRSNLASALRAQAKYAEAEQEDRVVLRIRERVLGAEHPDTLSSRMDLANALFPQGKHAEAEQEHRAALKGMERVLGAEHPHTLNSRMNLASALQGQGKNAEAEQEYRAVLKVFERVLGAEHPDTLMSRNNLAVALQAQGKNAEAERENRAALTIRERVLGAEHPEIFQSCYNLALCLEGERRLKEALEFIKRAETGLKKTLGPNHPDTKDATQVREHIETALKIK